MSAHRHVRLLEGAQLGLFDREENERLVAARMVRLTLHEFEQALRIEGASAASAATYRAHLATATRDGGYSSPLDLLHDPPACVLAIRTPTRHNTRLGRFAAIVRFAETRLAPLAAEEFREQLQAGLPRRQHARDDLLDVEVGGSLKLSRRRPVFLESDADRLIDSAGATPRAGCALRDRAHAALLCGSSLTPHRILQLTWNEMAPFLDRQPRADRGAFESIVLAGRDSQVVFDFRSIEALDAHWRARGRPRSGYVLETVRGQRAPLTDMYASQLLAEASDRVGLTGLHRRNMNAPLLHRLLVEGWDRLAIREAFGFVEVRSVDRIERLIREQLMQMRAAEVIWLSTQPGTEPRWAAPPERTERNTSDDHLHDRSQQSRALGV